jgi:hypothetical protein
MTTQDNKLYLQFYETDVQQYCFEDLAQSRDDSCVALTGPAEALCAMWWPFVKHKWT